MDVKNIQQQHGNGNILIGFGRALGSMIEGVARGDSSVMRAVGGTIHTILSGAGNLNQKIVESVGDASSKVNTSTGGAIHNTLSRFSQLFHGFQRGIRGTIKWACILIFIIDIVFIVYQYWRASC